MHIHGLNHTDAIEALRGVRPQSMQFHSTDWQTQPFHRYEEKHYNRNYLQEAYIKRYWRMFLAGEDERQKEEQDRLARKEKAQRKIRDAIERSKSFDFLKNATPIPVYEGSIIQKKTTGAKQRKISDVVDTEFTLESVEFDMNDYTPDELENGNPFYDNSDNLDEVSFLENLIEYELDQKIEAHLNPNDGNVKQSLSLPPPGFDECQLEQVEHKTCYVCKNVLSIGPHPALPTGPWPPKVIV